jgi:hypothetical protein
MPAFEGLLEGQHNRRLMKLLYRLSEWHSLAKLRMHTDTSLELMEEVTKELGDLLRQFRRLTCSHFSTVELPREVDARVRRTGPKGASAATSNAASGGGDNSTQNKKPNAQQSLTGGRFLFLY